MQKNDGGFGYAATDLCLSVCLSVCLFVLSCLSAPRTGCVDGCRVSACGKQARQTFSRRRVIDLKQHELTPALAHHSFVRTADVHQQIAPEIVMQQFQTLRAANLTRIARR
jgi:hypothetical protein